MSDKPEVDTGEISDGYHTFNELYEHRHHLFIALMRAYPLISWRSKKHPDGTMFPGWFIAGMVLPTGSISYHMPERLWALLDNSGISTTEFSPKWDGHTSGDVVTRLAEWLK